MGETCPKCGRPIGRHWSCDIDECWPGEALCDVIAAAYARGIDDGVRLAKAHAYIERAGCIWFGTVDKAAAAAKGEA